MPCKRLSLPDSMEFNYASHKSDGKERKKGAREKATATKGARSARGVEEEEGEGGGGGGRGVERKNGRRVYVIASCVNMIVGSRPGAYLRTNYAT